MELLRSVLKNLPEFQELTAALEGGKSPAAVSGLAAVHRAHFAAALGQETGRPVVVVCADEGEAGRMARDLSYLTGGEVPVLASRSFVFHSIATVSRQWEHRRLALLWKLRSGELPCLVATVEALQQRTLPPEVLDSACTVLEPGQQADLNQLTEALTAAGYVRCDQVEGAGQFALRGGILDVYSPGMAAPVRAEFWGDELDTMGSFDPSTQRRTENVDRAVLLPAAETLPQLAHGGCPVCWSGWTSSPPRPGGTGTRTWPSPSSRTGTPWGRAAPSPPPTGTCPSSTPSWPRRRTSCPWTPASSCPRAAGWGSGPRPISGSWRRT